MQIAIGTNGGAGESLAGHLSRHPGVAYVGADSSEYPLKKLAERIGKLEKKG